MPRKSPRLGKKLTDQEKANLIKGRQKAKARRDEIKDFFEKNAKQILTAKFWIAVPFETREKVIAAIKKADNHRLDAEIKELEALLAQKRKERGAK